MSTPKRSQGNQSGVRESRMKDQTAAAAVAAARAMEPSEPCRRSHASLPPMPTRAPMAGARAIV